MSNDKGASSESFKRYEGSERSGRGRGQRGEGQEFLGRGRTGERGGYRGGRARGSRGIGRFSGNEEKVGASSSMRGETSKSFGDRRRSAGATSSHSSRGAYFKKQDDFDLDDIYKPVPSQIPSGNEFSPLGPWQMPRDTLFSEPQPDLKEKVPYKPKPFKWEEPKTTFHLDAKEFMDALNDKSGMILDKNGVPMFDCRGSHGREQVCQFCDGKRGAWVSPPDTVRTPAFKRYQDQIIKPREARTSNTNTETVLSIAAAAKEEEEDEDDHDAFGMFLNNSSLEEIPDFSTQDFSFN